jgi:uncharacterized membrane protein YfcA
LAPEHIAILIAGGLVAGFVAGVIGVGGGIIFAPVLYIYFDSVGIESHLIAPLVIGSSLFCTFVASVASSFFHERKKAVDWRVAIKVGIGSALAVFIMTRFVTTQPWFDPDIFKMSFSLVLLAVVGRMLSSSKEDPVDSDDDRSRGLGFLFGVGSLTGIVSAAAGVGGGVVLIPAYNQGLNISMIRSIGTSSATIIFVSLAGVLSYMLFGAPASVSNFSWGAVDFGTSLLLVLPSIITVRIGVYVAHRVDRSALRLGFACLALIVAFKLISSVIWP